MADDPFDHPKSLCRWASQEIHDLEISCAAFFETHPYEPIGYTDRALDEAVAAVRISKSPTDAMQRSAYRIINDLRNALDQVIYAATIALGASKPKKTAFPFGEDAHNFETALESTNRNSPYRDIPVELHDALRACQPFWRVEGQSEGNDLLRALAYIANPNKHQVPLRVTTSAGAWGIRSLVDMDLRPVEKWNAAEDEFEIARLVRTGPNPQYELSLHFFLGFGDVKGVGGKEVIPTFREALSMVEDIVAGVEAETARILGARA